MKTRTGEEKDGRTRDESFIRKLEAKQKDALKLRYPGVTISTVGLIEYMEYVGNTNTKERYAAAALLSVVSEKNDINRRRDST